jgi:signal transduction histidine kinase
MIPSLFPIYRMTEAKLHDGMAVSACSFCRKSVQKKTECAEHYRKVSLLKPGYHECPFGFTTRTFYFDGEMWAITGVIAFPRFNSEKERDAAKRFPENKTSREGIESCLSYLGALGELRADLIAKAAKVFPQAFHELRKLNAAILQHAEKEIQTRGEAPALQTIKSAAELMKNNFDILEALSNPEAMRAIPSDSTISLMDLAYKTKRVLLERANSRGMQVNLTGVKAIIRGSQKSFPIVPAVLIENAIKYGRANTQISVDISTVGKKAILMVENESVHQIDEQKCFERGSRFAASAAEGGGFGLFLAKEIVQAHQGSISCQSSSGIIRMVVELPLVKVVV